MPIFSKQSQTRLNSCDIRLQKVFNEVIKHWDCTVLEGHRGEQTQNEYYRTGKSKLKYPQGKHNSNPSLAVDVVPYPIDWEKTNNFIYFAGFVLGIARQMEIKLRWGGDWDQDFNTYDTRFVDMPHFEVVED